MVCEEGIVENMFIFFFFDNGVIGVGGLNKLFWGNKFSNYEGGYCVFVVVWWLIKILVGFIISVMMMGMDLLLIIMDFVGIFVFKMW